MSKYSNKQNLKVVKRVMGRGMSQQAASNMVGACKGDAQKRIKLYREYGPGRAVNEKRFVRWTI